MQLTRTLGVIHSVWAFAVLLSLQRSTVHANFFSRIVKFNDGDPESKPAPSGATAAMGPDAQVGSIITFEGGIPLAHLANNNKIPLVGIGVGNLQHEIIPKIVAEAIQDDKKSRLIDTAHASYNEELVALGILRGLGRLELGDDEKLQVHIVTKVWYTHLGYERTKLSVQESLQALAPVLENAKLDIRLHILLHWPRCFDNIPWMHCEQDEAELPEYIKAAGPNPNENPENAWKESWKLLEDIYLSDEFPVASIGVSNFHLNDIEKMDTFARIHPHILQVNVWSLLYDAHLIEYCHKHRIHVQVYNAMQSTILQPETAPRAYHHIQKVALEISNQTDMDLTPAQAVLAWLIQHGVSVIPKTSKIHRLAENSAVALSSIPAFTDLQVETLAHAVEAYLSGDDLAKDIHVSVTFHAVSKDIMLYWLGSANEVRIALIRKGQSFNETTYPNHSYRTYDALNKDVFVDHSISANFGDHEHIHVEL
jgi:diketogulonate reductase-like aldo/keto reductase